MNGQRKASLDDVKKDIAPYLEKRLLKKPYMKHENVTPVCQVLYSKYDNVQISMKASADGKPIIIIKVKGFLSGGELSYEIEGKGRNTASKDPLSWIDRMEDFDAFMN